MKRIYILIVLCILSEWVKGQVSGNQNYIYTQTYITSDKQKSLELQYMIFRKPDTIRNEKKS